MTNEKLTEKQEIRRIKKLIEDMHKFNTKKSFDELEINGAFYDFFFCDDGSFAFGTITNEEGWTYARFDSASFLYNTSIRLEELEAAYLLREIR